MALIDFAEGGGMGESFDYRYQLVEGGTPGDDGRSVEGDRVFRHPRLAEMLAFWRERVRGGRLPSRDAFDPVDMRRFLGDVYLIDVSREPRRFRFRLVGTRMVAGLGRDATGLYFSEIYDGAVLGDAMAAYGLVVDRRAPVRLDGTAYFARKDFIPMEAVLMPLSSDGTSVDMILGMMVFGDPTP